MEKKKQHTIPECYLKNFIDKEGNLWILTKEDKIFIAKPKNILTGNHFYTVKFPDGGGSFIIEDTLANIESSFISIFRAKIEKKIPLEKKERAIISMFVASMLLRTKLHRKMWQNFLNEMKDWVQQIRQLPEENKAVLAAMPRSGGPSISGKEIIKASKDIGTFHSVSLAKALPKISQIIFNMKWAFLIPENEDECFITSDNPCALVNPIAEEKFGPNAIGSSAGLAQLDVDLTLPLSSKIALLTGWKLNQEEYTKISKKIVDQINYRSIRYGQDQVISSQKEKLQEVLKKIPSK